VRYVMKLRVAWQSGKFVNIRVTIRVSRRNLYQWFSSFWILCLRGNVIKNRIPITVKTKSFCNKYIYHLQLVPRSRKCGSIHPLPHTPS
jgi:hypothetical protein